MNSKLPISCFIIAKNEADRISKTIESVIDIVDEVIVIDSRVNNNYFINNIYNGFNCFRYSISFIFSNYKTTNRKFTIHYPT